MTEWSKVLRSGRSVFARVGSNPTVCIFPFSIHSHFLLFAIYETSMHEECNGMCFAYISYWFVLCVNEMQGVLVLIEKINWRSKEGSDYAFWLICRLIVNINQRAEAMFILFILSSQRYSLDSFWSLSVRIVELCKSRVCKVHQKVHCDAEVVINILVSIFNSLLIIVAGPQSSRASIWSPYRILFYMRSCYYRRWLDRQ